MNFNEFDPLSSNPPPQNQQQYATSQPQNQMNYNMQQQQQQQQMNYNTAPANAGNPFDGGGGNGNGGMAAQQMAGPPQNGYNNLHSQQSLDSNKSNEAQFLQDLRDELQDETGESYEPHAIQPPPNQPARRSQPGPPPPQHQYEQQYQQQQQPPTQMPPPPNAIGDGLDAVGWDLTPPPPAAADRDSSGGKSNRIKSSISSKSSKSPKSPPLPEVLNSTFGSLDISGKGVNEDGEDEDEEEDDEDGWGDDSDDDVQDLAESLGLTDDNYTVVFTSSEPQLGMLLERQDKYAEDVDSGNNNSGSLDGTNSGSSSNAPLEFTIVKMVVEGGPACQKGVKEGSVLVMVDEEVVVGKRYTYALDLVKSGSRPMKLTFKKGISEREEGTEGYCLAKKGIMAPTSYGGWRRRYYVLGGAIGRPNLLQIYPSKQEYERAVVAIFSRSAIKCKVKVVNLDRSHKVSPLKSKTYKGGGGAPDPYGGSGAGHGSTASPLHFFSIKKPGARMKAYRVASHDYGMVSHLHHMVVSYAALA